METILSPFRIQSDSVKWSGGKELFSLIDLFVCLKKKFIFYSKIYIQGFETVTRRASTCKVFFSVNNDIMKITHIYDCLVFFSILNKNIYLMMMLMSTMMVMMIVWMLNLSS